MNTQYQYGGAQSPVTYERKKPAIKLSKTDYVFAVLFAISSLLMAFIGFTEGFAVGYTVAHTVLLTVMFCYLVKSGKVNFLSISALIISFLSGITFTLYSGDRSVYLAAAVNIASGVLYTVSLFDIGVDSFDDILKMFLTAFPVPIMKLPIALRSLTQRGRKKTVSEVIIAVLISIPLLALVITLLSSYDAAFQGLITEILRVMGKIIFRFVLTLFIFIFVFTYALTLKYRLFGYSLRNIGTKPHSRFVKDAFSVTILGLLAFVYLLFIASQFAYIFNAFRGLLPENFTFSQYARRGFFEAEAIAFINLCVMLFFTRFANRRENGVIKLPVKILFTFITLFSVFLIITAGLKMYMYIGSYGLTVARLCASTFMAASVFFLLAFIIRVHAPKSKPIKYAVVLSLLLFTALSLAGIDRTVADYNVSAYLNGKLKSVDITTLAELDKGSAAEHLLRLTKCGDKQVEKSAEEALSYMCNSDNFDSSKKFIEFEKKNVFGYTVFYSRARKLISQAHVPSVNDFNYKYFRPRYEYSDPVLDEVFNGGSYDSVAVSATDFLQVYSGIDCYGGNAVVSVDNHGGFFGDGTTYVAIQYYDDSVERQIARNEKWKPLPVSDDLSQLIYGDCFTEIRDYGIPEISNGYYFFYDRHSEADNPYDESGFFDRYSYNFTCALFDADTDTLYYVKADT